MSHLDPSPLPQPVSLARKFALFTEQWAPKVIAEMNDYQFKIVRIEGVFVWHVHADTDEAFLVVEGELRIEFRDGHILLRRGELYVVPKGVEHRTCADHEVWLMLVEPRGVLNTGDSRGERTAQNDVWI
ncbi:TPA: cupin domain-containing protein [Stenotrophomonas maltophilia]|jgi:mannose-6-phosphate isomerase-like protein (cupin superfamily)|uniref:cupin domain-containing protein n=1 Tax=Stenotrophomonas TaxID=40323 RepID=UPI00050A1E8D|nr:MULTISPECIES: cupin domain-containing protein [Stenotrophomonas]EKT4086706.1 cupin domain-containing protein [Stenotrophomonas maltophilia]KGM24736.1 cupin [Stenotrophomonas maltophilia]MBN5158310.1 cupin domain-containing protein [Stenotrophomonas maltophilia]MDG9842231.1 cupin domain-containing protein [Stenotrophomonas sp. GD04054]MDH0018048.1 cupin domain-containing protein [Stenotrophomonas sp. GD04028]